MNITDILSVLKSSNCDVRGDTDAVATQPSPLFDGLEKGFAFHDIKRVPDMQQVLSESCAAIIMTNYEGPIPAMAGRAIVVVAEPRKSYIKVLNALFGKSRLSPEIMASAQIHPEAVIPPSAFIGHHCVIGRCRIGEDTVIEHNVVLQDGVQVGKRVRIKAGAVIGNDGFSFAKDDDGSWMRFIHTGGVVIEDNVEIGSNTLIDCGTFGNTVVGKGTKIDNLCHIAHNVQIGENCVIMAGTVLSGSDIIKDRVWVSPGVVVKDVLQIGNGAFIGMGSVVIRNIKDGERVFGNPAFRLPDMK